MRCHALCCVLQKPHNESLYVRPNIRMRAFPYLLQTLANWKLAKTSMAYSTLKSTLEAPPQLRKLALFVVGRATFLSLTSTSRSQKRQETTKCPLTREQSPVVRG